MLSRQAALVATVLLAVLAVPGAVDARITITTRNRLTDAQVLGFFDEWNSRLSQGPDKVADLYADSAVLLPTLSDRVRDTREEIIDYFVGFLSGRPTGRIDEYEIRRPDRDVALLMGIYTFTFAAGNSVQARFSFTYKRFGNNWLIIEHHSSAMPESYASELIAAFDTWNDALLTKEPAVVADLYTPEAVLLPTLSNRVRTTREEIIDYFVQFLAGSPVGSIVSVPGESPNMRLLSPGVAINSGIYRFDLTNNGTETAVYARYSYTYVKYGSKWMIVDHHSSAMPEQPYEPPAEEGEEGNEGEQEQQ